MDPQQQIPVNQQDAAAAIASNQVSEAMDLQMQQQQVRVEDLPLDKKLEILKKHNYFNGYDEGRFIDAQDTVNTWCLGQISQVIDAKNIKVHYDGWSTKWDTTTKITSQRIAPFRRWSRGYTGQTRVALRQNMKFSLDELAQEKERVTKLLDDDLNGLGAFETTQYFRGRLYVFVDHLLQNGKYQPEEVDAINDFIVQVLRLITQWFRKAQKLVPLYSQIKVNPDLFLIDENIAILLSANELLDIMKKIFGGCHRCLKYYYLNDKAQVPLTDNSVTQDFTHLNFEEQNRRDEEEIDVEFVKDVIANRKNIQFGQMINFLNIFAEIGGFDAIIGFLKIGNESQDDKMPIDLITQIVSPFRTCNSIFSETFAKAFVTQLKDIVSQRLQTMTEKEIKEIDKEAVSLVLKSLKDFLTLALTDLETAQFIEINQLNISLRFLKSTYLEKKLKGLQEIKHLISSIELAQTIAERRNNMQGYNGRMIINQDFEMQGNLKEKPPKFINAESLKQWLLDQKVLDIIFGENTHVEIVKRSASVIIFLAKQGALPNEVVDLVWRSQIGKHEDMVRVVYSTIQEILPEINVIQADLFYQKIQLVLQSQYDDKFLQFLKDFTLKALATYKKHRSDELGLAESHPEQFEDKINKREIQVISKIADYLGNPQSWDTEDKQYGMPVFWAMIQDGSSNVSNELTLQASACLAEILRHESSQPVKISYLIRALDNIKRGESVAQSVILAQNIISEYPSYAQPNTDGTLIQENIIDSLEKQLGLIGLIIKNIGSYNIAVKEKTRALSEKNKTLPDDVSNYIFVGKHTHQDTLDHLLGFLEFLIINSEHKVTLGKENIDKLWFMFVQQPNLNVDQTLFLKWINKQRDAGTTTYGEQREHNLFNEEERIHFFTSILCNPTYGDFGKISVGQVKCFHKYFKIINRCNRVIDGNNKKIIVLDFTKLLGLDTLWKIAVESENDRSRDESMDLLVDLHLKFDNQITPPDFQSKIWARFIEHCMSQLESDKENIVRNNINLISKFLDRYEGKKTLKAEMKQQYNQYQQSSVIVILRPDNIKQNVQMNYYQNVGWLRVKIAETFGFQINEFIMVIKNQMVDSDEDDEKLLREFGLIQQILIQKNPNYNPDRHPKYQISQDQKNYDKLFTLLSKDSKSHLIEATWDLLQKLPVNQKLHQEIKELSGMSSTTDNKQIWEKILDSKSINKLLYSLQIVNQMQSSTNRKDQKQSQWRYKFVQMGGLQHLLRTFLSLNIKSIETNLTLRCIELLIITLTDIMNADREGARDQLGQSIQLLLAQKEQVVHTCIMLVDMISDYCLAQEKARGEPYEEIQKRIVQNKLKKNKYKAYMVQTKAQAQQQTQEDEEDHESAEYNQMQQIIKQFTEQNAIVSSLFKFLQFNVFVHDNSSSVGIANYENLGQMLIKSSVKVENNFIRLEVMKRVKDIIISKSDLPEMKEMLKIVKILAFDMQEIAEQNEARVFNYYEGFTVILDGLKVSDLEPLKEPFLQMISDLGQFIFKRELKERSTTEIDQLLLGKIKLLRSLLQKYPEQKRIIGDYLTKHLVIDCLFDIPSGGSHNHSKVGPPKCKSHESRRQALKLLAVLCRDCPQNLDLVLKFMHDFNMNPSWRTNKDLDWSISLMDSEKSSTGYVGIKNLGCICYMNSLFQQLFMITSLRNSLLEVPDNESSDDKDENMFYQLQLLFAGLLKSEKQYVNPKGFCHAFKDWDGNPTNVLEQMDVEEFFNMLMDRIETAIKGTGSAKTIQYHFGGKYASEMICKGCPHKYEREEAFLSVGVPVKNQKSIQQGLLASVQGEMLEGDNAYYCEKCDKKVDTLKRTCIKKLPRYLILPLKRFEFDYDRMIRVKVNDYCEFPMELNMEPYTQEGLSKRERIAKIKEEKGDDEEAQQAIEEIEKEPLKYPKEYYEYQISGIVVHSGTADSGHYYSFIKDRDHPESGKWYEMNDALVRDFDPKDIPSECFGGEDTFVGYNMMQVKSMKLRNAYLLFYERKTPTDVQSDEEKESENITSNASVPLAGVEKMTDEAATKEIDADIVMSSRGIATTQSAAISKEIEEKILYENQKYWQNRFLFGNEYHEFVYDLSLNWNTSCLIPKEYLTKNNDFHIVNQQCPQEYIKDVSISDPIDQKIPIDDSLVPELELRVFKFAASCYLTILQRAQNKQPIPTMLNLLKAYINKNEQCAHWLITEFCNMQIIEEMLLQCNSKEMRRFVVGLLYCAMLKLYPYEKDRLNQYWVNPQDPANNSTAIGNFALILMGNLAYAKKFSKNLSQYLQLFARLTSLGKEIREFFLKSRLVGILMNYIFEEFSPHQQIFRDASNFIPKYNENPDMGLPTVIDKKQMNQFQEMLERKRLKALSEGIPHFKYIYEAVSYCIRALPPHGVQSQNTLPSPLQLDEIQGIDGIIQQERDLFFPDYKFLYKLFNNQRKNRGYKFLSLCYCHYTWFDKDDYNNLLLMIQAGLTDNDYMDIKPFLYLVTQLLITPGGDRSENRFEKTLLWLFEVIENNIGYYKFTETFVEYFFKLCAGVPTVMQWVLANRDKWQFLIEWQTKVAFPMDQTGPNRLYKRRTNSYTQYPQYMRNEAYKNQFLREARLERFRMLFKGNNTAEANELSLWLLDMEDYKFKVGEQFEVYNRKTEQLTTCQVETVLDEMVQHKYLYFSSEGQYSNQNQISWIAKDSNKIQPINTYKNQYQVRLYEHYESNHEQRVRAQAQQQTAHGRVDTGDHEMQGVERSSRFQNTQGGAAGGYPTGDNSDPGDDSEDDEDDMNP